MMPAHEKISATLHKAHHDPMSITIDEAYEAGASIIDVAFKNRDSCQFIKVFDDYKNWCINNMDMCVGNDEGYLERIYAHGYDLFGAFYDVMGIYLFESSPCSTDAEFIDVNRRLVEDMASIGSVILGFEADYNMPNEHVSNHEFKHEIKEYFEGLYESYLNQTTSWMSEDATVYPDMEIYLYEEPSFSFPVFPVWSFPASSEQGQEMPHFDFPTFEMPTYDMPAFPEMPPMPEFPKFMHW